MRSSYRDGGIWVASSSCLYGWASTAAAGDAVYLVVYLLVSIQKNPNRSVSRVYDHTNRIACIEDSLEVTGNHTAIFSVDRLCLRLWADRVSFVEILVDGTTRSTLAIAITIISAHCSWILMSGAALVRWLDVPIRLVGAHHRGGNNRRMSGCSNGTRREWARCFWVLGAP